MKNFVRHDIDDLTTVTGDGRIGNTETMCILKNLKVTSSGCDDDFNPIITNLTNWFNGNGFPEKAELASWGFMHILVIYAEGKLRGNMENVNTENYLLVILYSFLDVSPHCQRLQQETVLCF